MSVNNKKTNERTKATIISAPMASFMYFCTGFVRTYLRNCPL